MLKPFSYLKQHRNLLVTLLFFCCVFLSFGVKTYHYNNEVAALTKVLNAQPAADPGFLRKFFPIPTTTFMPFTIESAMMFSYAQDIAEGKGVPESDPTLLGQTDLPPYAQMNMALEWFLGWGYRIKNAVCPDAKPTPAELRYQDHPGMAYWMSIQIRFWASLTSGFIFLWLVLLKCPLKLALFGGCLHAISLAAVARSTGQDLVRGEFCIPLIAAAIVLLITAVRNPARWKYLLLFAVTFLAFVSWDLCQMLFSCLAVFEIFRYLIGGRIKRARIHAWLMILLAVVLNALLVPFNKTYGLIMSPLLCVILPTMFLLFLTGRKRPDAAVWKRIVLLLLVPLCLYLFWNGCINNPTYESHYSHFSEVMRAKLQFHNVKPADPEKLTYDARIMWTPSMHSATWQIARTFFPSFFSYYKINFTPLYFVLCLMPLTLAFFYILLVLSGIFTAVRISVGRGLCRSLMPVLFTAGFTVGFVYVVRYHEFLILFLAVALPLLVQDYLRAFRLRTDPVPEDAPYLRLLQKRGLVRTVRIALITICTILFIVELDASLFKRTRKYTGDVHLRNTADLIEWFRRYPYVKGKGVLANFTVGPMLKAYCGTAIALNPQFGLERLRRPTELYLNLMYHGTEQALAEFCYGLNIDYVVFNENTALPGSPLHVYSNQYIAAAKEIEPGTPVYLMQHKRDTMTWFFPLNPPRDLRTLSGSYTVFRVITPKDKQLSLRFTMLADQAAREGNLPAARQLAAKAVLADPTHDTARYLFIQVFGREPAVALDGIH